MTKLNTNQNRQFYVVKEVAGFYKAAASEVIGSKLTKDSAEGSVFVGVNPDGAGYIQQVGKGGIVSTGIIENISRVKKTAYTAMRRPLKKYKISLDSNVNGGAPIAGQDYIIQFQIKNAFGGGMNDIYLKMGGSVYATTGMNASKFWAAMYKSILLNFKREQNDWFEFDVPQASVTVSNAYTLTAKDGGTDGNSLKYTLSVSGDAESVTVSGGTVAIVLTAANKTVGDLIRVLNENDAPISAAPAGTATTSTTLSAVVDATSLSGGADYITIKEKELSWKLGKTSDDGIDVTFVTPVVESDHVEVQWAKVDDLTPAVANVSTGEFVGNGKKTADMEYFFHGERGDQYRDFIGDKMIDTEYMVDSTKEYDFFDIHFAYQGSCEDIQKSERDITLVVDHTLTQTQLDSAGDTTVTTNLEKALEKAFE